MRPTDWPESLPVRHEGLPPEFGCAVSLPRLVGGGGILREIGVPMDEGERTRLRRSADLLCDTLSRVDA